MKTSLIIALCVSVIINIFAFWYLRRVLPRVLYVSRNLSDLVDLITNYKQHISSVYRLDMYYGDETIKFLMSHTTSLLEVLEEFEDEGALMEPIPEEESIEEGERIDAETEINQENVFYAGSRRRDN